MAQSGDALIVVASVVRVPLAVALAVSLPVSAGFGQWSAAIEVGAARFWGGSFEAGPEHRSFRPYRPATFGAALQRRVGSVSLGMRLWYTEAGLALEGSDAVVVAKGIFTIYSALPELSYRLATIGAGNRLELQGGPLLEVWRIVDEKSRTRLGLQGGGSLHIPLGGRLTGTLGVGAALIPSPFEEGELPGYNLRPLWRRRFAAGLRCRL